MPRSPLVWLAMLGAMGLGSVNADEPASPSERFREIVIAAAADFDSPLHAEAVHLVQANDFRSERLNGPIKEALRVQSLGAETANRLEAAVNLLPHSTLEPSQQVERLLDALAAFEEPYADFARSQPRAVSVLRYGRRTGVSLLAGYLSKFPGELADQLATRFEKGERPVIFLTLAEETESAGGPLLPTLLDAAEEGDAAAGKAALRAAHVILRSVEKTRRGTDAPNDTKVTKLIDYSHRIISRYDRDENGTLTEPEWANMLVSPAAADRDDDGEITAEEYAEFLAQKSVGTNSEQMLNYARRIISRYDRDESESLSRSEWAKMPVPPDGADRDQDGEITAEEYARLMAEKSSASNR